jgi:hypothetical protein
MDEHEYNRQLREDYIRQLIGATNPSNRLSLIFQYESSTQFKVILITSIIVICGGLAI